MYIKKGWCYVIANKNNQFMKQKLILVTTMLLLFSVGLNAQLRKIPAAVTEAFKDKYPGATNVEWKDKLTNFEAAFILEDDEWTAQFNSKGEWKESAKRIEFDDLPEAVKDGFNKSKYSNWTTGSVRMIESDKGTSYKIYAEKNSIIQKVFLYFSDNGKLLRETPGI